MLTLDINIEQIRENYLKNKKSIRSLGKQYKIKFHKMKRLLIKHNIPLRYETEARRLHRILLDTPENLKLITKLYSENNYSINHIASLLNTCNKVVTDFLKRNNIKIHLPANKRIFLEGTDDNINKIKNLYYDKQLSINEISKKLNISLGKIYFFMRRHKLIRRKHNDKINVKKAYSRKSYILPSGRIIQIQGYEPQFLDFVFQNNLLNENEIVYLPDGIAYNLENKNRIYFPDFYIPKFNLIVEIKSHYILRRQGYDVQKAKEDAVKNKGFKYCLILNNIFDNFINIIKN